MYLLLIFLLLEMIRSMSRHSKGLKKPLDSVVTKTYPHYIDPTISLLPLTDTFLLTILKWCYSILFMNCHLRHSALCYVL